LFPINIADFILTKMLSHRKIKGGPIINDSNYPDEKGAAHVYDTGGAFEFAPISNSTYLL
jgi:hypothetical protein